MKKLMLLLCFFSLNLSANEFFNTHIDHYDQDKEYIETSTPLPKKLKAALEVFFKSPLGIKIKNQIENYNIKMRFVRGYGVDGDFSAEEQTIYYTTDVNAWYERHKNIIPPKSNLDLATLDVLIAHEFGHTQIGRDVFNLETINSFLETQIDNGEIRYIFDRKLIQKEELRTTALFENTYRASQNILPRFSYYTEGDVTRFCESTHLCD